MESSGVKISSLIGRSDFSVFSKPIASAIRDNDNEAMEGKKVSLNMKRL